VGCDVVHPGQRGTTRPWLRWKVLGVRSCPRPLHGTSKRNRATRRCAGRTGDADHPPRTSSSPPASRRRPTTSGIRWRNDRRSRDAKMAAGHMTTQAVLVASRIAPVWHSVEPPTPPLYSHNHNRCVLNPLQSRGNYSATSNNIELVHWPLVGGLLHLVHRGGN